MNHRDFFKQNTILITAIHMIAWAVLSGVGVVVIIIAGLFGLFNMILLMVFTFIVTLPVSFLIARALNGASPDRNE